MAKPEVKKTTNGTVSLLILVVYLVGGMAKRDMRKKLADLRNKSKKASKEQSDKKHESILSSFGKRKHSTEDENTVRLKLYILKLNSSLGHCYEYPKETKTRF